MSLVSAGASFGSRKPKSCSSSCSFGTGALLSPVIFRQSSVADEVIRMEDSEQFVVVFAAKWCGACSALESKFINPLEKTPLEGFPKVYFVHTDNPVANAEEVIRQASHKLVDAEPLRFKSIPTTLAFEAREGKITVRTVFRGGDDKWTDVVHRCFDAKTFGATVPATFGTLRVMSANDRVVVIAGPSWSHFTHSAKTAAEKLAGIVTVTFVDSEDFIDEFETIRSRYSVAQPARFPATLVKRGEAVALAHEGFYSEEAWLKDVRSILDRHTPTI